MKLSYKWTTLIIVSIGVFISTLDLTIVNVALPEISEYFNTRMATIEWVMTAYLLTITGLLLSMGKLSDMIGKKTIFLSGFVIFIAGSFLCAISGNEIELIFFRVIQGTGAAMIMATGPAIVTHTFPDNERGKAIGLVGAVVGIGSLAGPLSGGFLIQNLGWRSVFYINVPIGIIGLFATIYYLNGENDFKTDQKFDLKGAVALFMSLISLLLALNLGQGYGWGSLFVLSMIVSSILFFLIFLIIEKKAKQPMIEINLLTNRTFTTANISVFINFAALFAVFFIFPFFMEKVYNYPPAKIGFAIGSVPFGMAIVAPISGWMSDRKRSKVICVAGIIIASMAIFLLGGLDAGSEFSRITIFLCLLGLGFGIFQAPNNSLIMGSVPKERLGIASGTMATMRSLGMVMGVAIAGAIFSNRLLNYTDNADLNAFHDTFIAASIICLTGVLPVLIDGSEKKCFSNHQVPYFKKK
jgi:EmrB/QacA subfamily drug resistance transporter